MLQAPHDSKGQCDGDSESPSGTVMIQTGQTEDVSEDIL